MNESSTSFAFGVLLLVCGCASPPPDAPSASVPDASTASDASSKSDASSEHDAPPVTCALNASGTCGEGCCPAVTGRRIDFAKRCIARSSTPLGCPGPGTGCTAPDAEGCLVRLDSNGGEPEAYRTPQLQGAEGFVTCPDDLRVELNFETCEE